MKQSANRLQMVPPDSTVDAVRGCSAEGRLASPSGRRAIVFRLLAIVLGLSPFVVLELGLRLAGWGNPADAPDPFVGFSALTPLFVLDQQTDRYVIPPSRQSFFCPESFAAHKADNEFRIFCLGGSTVQGRPYAIETAFSTWLELSLRAADPNRTWEVVNCGGVSYASYRLVPILEELLRYEPDLFVIYTGHNEFLEDRTYGWVKRTPRWLIRLHAVLADLRVYRVGAAGWRQVRGRATQPPVTLPAEVDTILDYQGGLADYHRDEPWRQAGIEHYVLNLRRMKRLADQAGVPTILINPVSNLKDCPPFKSEHRPGLTGAEQDRFHALWDEAKRLGADAFERKIELLRSAIAIDDRYAAVHFHLGKCYETAGRGADALNALRRAKEEDVCPLRMLDEMHARLLRLARDTNTPMVDVDAIFRARSETGIPGNQLLVDHVHPDIHGHQMIADALLRSLEGLHVVAPRADHRERQEQLYRDHVASLENTYFVRGKERLEGLRRWAEGRSNNIRAGD